MSTWITIAVVCSAVFHASLELRGKLADYLGEVVGFIPPWWLKYALFVLALVLILVPLGLGFFQILRDFFFAEAAGALLGDTFSTHLIPTWRHLAGRSSPATWTWILYLPLGVAILANLRPLNSTVIAGIIVGILSFVLLWPLLKTLTRIGFLPKPHSI